MSLKSLNKIDFVSDHKCITFDTSLLPTTITQKHIIHSRIFNEPVLMTYFSCFNELCRPAFDFFAQYTSRAVPVINTTAWINDNIRQQRREYKKAKSKWKKFHHLHMKLLKMCELPTFLA